MPKGHYDHKPRTDVTGQRFGDWTAIKLGEPRGRAGRRWVCRCICGAEREVALYSLRSGKSTGCGCRAAEKFRSVLTTHGLSQLPEHRIWIAMRARCSSPSNTAYLNYGARGIRVDARWDDFETFLADMGRRPSAEYSIERRDGTLGYSPENCYWATIKQQNRNTARNRFLTFEGETLTVAEWAERKGMTYGALSNRIRDGWSTEDALTIPVGRGSARVAHKSSRLQQQGVTGHR